MALFWPFWPCFDPLNPFLVMPSPFMATAGLRLVWLLQPSLTGSVPCLAILWPEQRGQALWQCVRPKPALISQHRLNLTLTEAECICSGAAVIDRSPEGFSVSFGVADSCTVCCTWCWEPTEGECTLILHQPDPPTPLLPYTGEAGSVSGNCRLRMA